jgi:hypothetical protein
MPKGVYKRTKPTWNKGKKLPYKVWNSGKKLPFTIWNKGLTKDTDSRIKEQGERLSVRYKNGELKPSFLGKHHTKKSKERIGRCKKGKKLTKEQCENISRSQIGKVLSQEHKNRIGISWKRNKNRNLAHVLESVCRRPNKFETNALNYLNTIYENKFVYTGDGSLIVDGRSADAYSKELNTVCLFQGNYFHCNPRMYKSTYYNGLRKMFAKDIWKRDAESVKMFKRSNYRVIVIWEDTLNKLID